MNVKEVAWLTDLCHLWLLDDPFTSQHVSVSQNRICWDMLPYWDRSCRSNFLSHPATVYWHSQQVPALTLVYLRDGSTGTCCYTEIEAADQTFYLAQPQYIDTESTSPSTDPIMHCTWQGSHWSGNAQGGDITRPGKIFTAKAGVEPRSAHQGRRLTSRPTPYLEADALPRGQHGGSQSELFGVW